MNTSRIPNGLSSLQLVLALAGCSLPRAAERGDDGVAAAQALTPTSASSYRKVGGRDPLSPGVLEVYGESACAGPVEYAHADACVDAETLEEWATERASYCGDDLHTEEVRCDDACSTWWRKRRGWCVTDAANPWGREVAYCRCAP